jgi:hypothetical protein
MEVCKTFLQDGTPLNKLEGAFGALLLREHSTNPDSKGGGLMHSSDMPRVLYPTLMDDERNTQKAEVLKILNSDFPLVALMHDETPDRGEVAAILMHYIDFDGPKVEVKSRLIEFAKHTQKFDSKQLAGFLRDGITKVGLTPECLANITSDGASTNKGAFDTLTNGMFQHHQNGAAITPTGIKEASSPLRNECISHGVSNVGNSADFPFVSLLWLLLAKVMMHSQAAQALWKEVTGLTFTKMNLIRWFHVYEDIKKAAPALDHLVDFIKRCEGDKVSSEGVKQLRGFVLNKPWSLTMIKIEVAEYVRLGKTLVECCYATEGDNQRAFRAHATYTRMQQVLDDEEYEAAPTTRGNLISTLKAQVRGSYPTELEGNVALRVMERKDQGRHGGLRVAAVNGQEHIRAALGIVGAEDNNEEEQADKAGQKMNKQIKQLVSITNKLIMEPPVTEEGADHWVWSAKEPARKHLHDMFDNADKKRDPMVFFRGADILRPDSMSNLIREIDDVYDDDEFEDELKEAIRKRAKDLLSHPKADSTNLEQLKEELVEYAFDVEIMIEEKTEENAAFDICEWTKETNLLDWHYQRREDHPLIFASAALTALAQPSSGAVERVFSRYRNLFDVGQQSMYWDEDSSGKILGMFLSYNKRMPTKTQKGAMIAMG